MNHVKSSINCDDSELRWESWEREHGRCAFTVIYLHDPFRKPDHRDPLVAFLLKRSAKVYMPSLPIAEINLEAPKSCGEWRARVRAFVEWVRGKEGSHVVPFASSFSAVPFLVATEGLFGAEDTIFLISPIVDWSNLPGIRRHLFSDVSVLHVAERDLVSECELFPADEIASLPRKIRIANCFCHHMKEKIVMYAAANSGAGRIHVYGGNDDPFASPPDLVSLTGLPTVRLNTYPKTAHLIMKGRHRDDFLSDLDTALGTHLAGARGRLSGRAAAEAINAGTRSIGDREGAASGFAVSVS